MKHLKTLRKIVGGLVLIVFFVGPLLAAVRLWPHVPGRLLMEMDPLVALATGLATGVLYSGLWLAVVVSVLTLVFGRFFCSWVCPLGTLQDLASVAPRDKKAAAKKARNRYRDIYFLKYALLLALLVLAVLGPVQVGLLDPLALYLRTLGGVLLPGIQAAGVPIGTLERVTAGGLLVGLMMVAVLAVTRFVPRAWCRTVCPLGATFGVLGRWSLLSIRRDEEACVDCGRCARVCNGAADPDSKLRPSECVLCFNCIGECPYDALTYGLPAPVSAQAPQSPDLTRRRALTAAGAGILAYPLLRSSLSSANTPSTSLIRPPGSLEEEEFLARCVKCGACTQVCPTGGLQPAYSQGGAESLWTPVLLPRIGHCEASCTRCSHHCPTGAIKEISQKQRTGTKDSPPIKIGTAFVDRGRCLPWAMGKPCLVCEEVCPVSPKAIIAEEAPTTSSSGRKVTLGRPRVIPERCIGCGACENHCPMAGRAAIRVSSVGESRSRKNRFLLSATASANPSASRGKPAK